MTRPLRAKRFKRCGMDFQLSKYDLQLARSEIERAGHFQKAAVAAYAKQRVKDLLAEKWKNDEDRKGRISAFAYIENEALGRQRSRGD